MNDEVAIKKLKLKSAPQLEKIADRWFSWYIRLEAADFDGNCRCCTCGRKFFWKDMDNGHYVPRDRIQTRYSEKNCGPQCTSCNRYKYGAKDLHKEFIDKKYGQGTAQQLKDFGAMPSKDASQDFYIMIILTYKGHVKYLEKEKGLRVNES